MSVETEVKKWDRLDTALSIGALVCFTGGWWEPGLFGFALIFGSVEYARSRGRVGERVAGDMVEEAEKTYKEIDVKPPEDLFYP